MTFNQIPGVVIDCVLEALWQNRRIKRENLSIIEIFGKNSNGGLISNQQGYLAYSSEVNPGLMLELASKCARETMCTTKVLSSLPNAAVVSSFFANDLHPPGIW